MHCALFNNIDSMRSGPASIKLNREQTGLLDNQSVCISSSRIHG
jgi:hypothetical protein